MAINSGAGKKKNPKNTILGNGRFSIHSDTDRSFWRWFELFSSFKRFGPTILDRYIFREIMQPFGVALFLFTTLFMTIVLKDVAAELLGKGIDADRVLLYIVYLLGEQITETIPMACLLAGILAAGRLSGDSEITAMRSAGISFPRIYSVFLFTGFLFAVIVTYMNLYWGPMAARAREDFEDWLRAYHSLTLVQAGRFLGAPSMDGVSETGQDIYAGGRVGNVLQNVQIREWYTGDLEGATEHVRIRNMHVPIGNGFITQIVHAEEGEMVSRIREDGEEEKFIRLRRGFMIERDMDSLDLQITDFKNGFMDYVLPPPAKSLGRLNVRPENYTFPELFQFLEQLEEGGTKVDLTALAAGEDIRAFGGPGMEVDEDLQGDHIFEIPAYNEMERNIEQLRMWLFQNQGKVGESDGPTREEYQHQLQFLLQLEIFLKDADRTRRRFQVEIHRRLSAPVTSLLFFFVSFPLGLVVKRSGKGMSFSLAMIIFAIYYMFLTFGLQQAYSGGIPPALGAWLPTIVIGLIGAHVMSTRTEGFAPLRFLTAPLRFVYNKTLGRILSPVFYRIHLLKEKIMAGIIEKWGESWPGRFLRK